MAVDTPIVAGSDNYVNIYTESTWGTRPASPTVINLPVTNYGVAMTRHARQSQPHYGQFGAVSTHHVNGMPAGQITGELSAIEPSGSTTSLAKSLLDWVFGAETSKLLPSMGIEFIQGGIADRQHNGMRVNQFTLTGAEGQAVTYSLDVMGKTESALGAAATAMGIDMKGFPGFEFSDVTLTLGGTAYDIKSFQLQRQHNLKTHYSGSTSPIALVKGNRLTSFQCVAFKQTDDWDDIRNSFTETNISNVLTIKGRHGGTSASGTFLQIAITMPNSRYLVPQDAHAYEDLSTVTLPFQCMIPNGGGSEISIAYSLV